MAPPALANLFCDDVDVQELLSALGVTLRLDDDGGGTLSAGESAFLVRAHSWATSRVLFYCGQLYRADEMASSWLVNEWATCLSACYVCSRRCNPVPDSIHDLVYGPDGDGGVMGDLKEVRLGLAQIPDVAMRNAPWPAWSNVIVDPRYRLRQIRVQRTISDKVPVRSYTQNVDHPSEMTWEF